MEITQEAFDAMQATLTALQEKLDKLETSNTGTDQWQNQINQLTEKLTALETKLQSNSLTEPELLNQITDLKTQLEAINSKANQLELDQKAMLPRLPKEKEADPQEQPRKRKPSNWIK